MSSYLVPIPAAKKRSGKLQFEESTGDRILENAFMNRMRGKVGVWRTGGVGNPGRGQQRPLPITLMLAAGLHDAPAGAIGHALRRRARWPNLGSPPKT